MTEELKLKVITCERCVYTILVLDMHGIVDTGLKCNNVIHTGFECNRIMHVEEVVTGTLALTDTLEYVGVFKLPDCLTHR